MSDEDLLDAVGRWYIPKRDVRYVRRNALVALGNAALGADDFDAVEQVLQSHAGGADAMLETHARWAAGQQGIELR